MDYWIQPISSPFQVSVKYLLVSEWTRYCCSIQFATTCQLLVHLLLIALQVVVLCDLNLTNISNRSSKLSAMDYERFTNRNYYHWKNITDSMIFTHQHLVCIFCFYHFDRLSVYNTFSSQLIVDDKHVTFIVNSRIHLSHFFDFRWSRFWSQANDTSGGTVLNRENNIYPILIGRRFSGNQDRTWTNYWSIHRCDVGWGSWLDSGQCSCCRF